MTGQPETGDTVRGLALRGINLISHEIKKLEEISEQGSLTPAEIRLLNECLKTLSHVSKDLDLNSEQFAKELATLETDDLVALFKSVADELGLQFEIKGTVKNESVTS